jgi:hypothetical protein
MTVGYRYFNWFFVVGVLIKTEEVCLNVVVDVVTDLAHRLGIVIDRQLDVIKTVAVTSY